MSIMLMGKVWERTLSHGQQAVMLALADHARDDGSHVYPSLSLVAWKTGYSLRQVKRIVSDLRRSGVLAVVAPARRGRPTEYRINLAPAKEKPSFSKAHSKGDTMPLQANPDDVTSTPVAVTSAADCGDIPRHIEPLEPSKNHQQRTRTYATAKNSPFNSTEVAQMLCQRSGWSGKELIWALRGAIDFQSQWMPGKSLEEVGESLLAAYDQHQRTKGGYAVGPQKFFAEGRYQASIPAKPDLRRDNPALRTLTQLEAAE